MAEKDKNIEESLRQDNLTFDETLQRDDINSALGQGSVNLSTPTQGADALNVLNSNSNNQPLSSDDDIKLNDEENAARESANLDIAAGINHSSEEDINWYKNQQRINSGLPMGTPDEGSTNVTKTNAEDLAANEEANIASGQLYRELLGDTAFGDLKAACGLSKSDSFTDFYNRTHYIPRGYELDVKLALAEERRMKEYVRYSNKEISYNTFLYNAYGKDLLKEQGYDFNSKLFWYNRYKNGDYSNPLDSSSFLQDLINNCDSLFKADSWYRDSSTKKLSSMMSGLATGTKLSTDEFKKVFSSQVEALAPYFDNDINKIMTYYRAGYLSSAFSPFVDVNGDGKFDYYFHNDGKLYAIDNDDSVGTGTAKATLVYNDDGSVHSAQVHEGIDGWADSLWDGFSQFFAGVADIGALAVNGVSAIFGVSFVDQQAKWESWKKEWLMDEDRIVFDSMSQWNGDDWGNAVAEAGGYIAGMVLLIIATMGVGALVSGTTSGIEAGVAAGQEGLKVVGEKATEASVKNGVSKATSILTQKLVAKEITQKQFNVAMNSMMRTFMKEGAKQGVTKSLLSSTQKAVGSVVGKVATRKAAEATLGEMAKKIGTTTATRMATKGAAQMTMNKIANVLVGQGITKTVTDSTGKVVSTKIGESVLTSVGRARGGAAISSFLSLTAKEGTKWAAITSNTWFRAGVNAAELAVRDVMQMTAQLQAQNKTLAYMQDNVKDENGNPVYHELSDSEIFLRVAGVAGADMIISTLFRATGDQGFSSRIRVDTSNVNRALEGMSDAYKNKLAGYIKHLRTWSVADSVLDVFENITTASTQAMLSNPYAQNAEAMGKTYVQSMLSPKAVAMNVYALSNNLFTVGRLNTSIYDDRMNALISSVKVNGKNLGNVIVELDKALVNSKSYNTTDLHTYLMKIKSTIDADMKNTKQSNIVENAIKAEERLGELFSDDIVESNKEAVASAFNLTKDEFDQVRQFIKDYNANAEIDGTEKLNFVTGKVLFDAQKANDEYVADVYKMILNQASSVSKQRMDAYTSWFSRSKFKLFNKSRLQYASGIESMMKGIGAKTIADFDGVINPVFKTFVSNRFDTLDSFTTIEDENEYQEAREREKIKLEELMSKDYVKTGSFSENNLNANIKYEWTRDPKTGEYKFTGTATEVPDIITRLFMNPEKNKGAIDAFVKAGYFTTDEDTGKIMAAGGAPLFYITVPSDKRNDFLKEFNNNPEVANFFNTLDLMALASQDGIFDTYNIPLLIKVKIATGTSDNPDAMQDVYVIGNNFGAGLTESVNRLQAFEATLYTLYKLYMNANEPNPDKLMSQKDYQRCMAQLGALLCEEATQDPYYDFLKEWHESDGKIENFEAQIKLATAYMLRGASMTDDKALFNRARLLELYRAGAISKSILVELQSHEKVGKTAKLLTDYIEYGVEEDNRIKTALGALVKLNEDSSNKEQQNIVINLIKDLNTKEHEELLNILRKDGKISAGLDELIKQRIEDPEAFANFWEELQSTTHLGAQTNLLSGLDAGELAKIKDELFKQFISPETIKLVSERTKRSYILKQTFKQIFGLKGSDAHFFNKMTGADIYKFLTDPIAEIDNYVANFRYKNGNGLSEKRKDIMADVAAKIKSDLLNDSNEFNYDKLFNHVMDFLTDGSGKISSNREIIENLVSIAIGKKFDGRKLKFNEATNAWVYEGKPVGKTVLTSKQTKKLIEVSLLPDAKTMAKKIVDKSIDFYYKDTVNADSLNIVTLNILDFLPENLYQGLKSLATSKALAKSADLSARISGDDLADIFNNLLHNYKSGSTISQYNAYMGMLDLALKTNSFVFTYNVNDETQMNELRKFLTSCGYSNALRDLEEEITEIPGLYFKKIKTHNINSTLNYQKLYDYAMSKAINNHHTTDISEAGKDFIPVLYNMFDSLNYVKGTDKVSLLSDTTPDEYEIKNITKLSTKRNKAFQYNVVLDRDSNKSAVVFDDIVYLKTDGKFNIGLTITKQELDRAIKGTLEGGSNLEKYIIRNRFLDVNPESDVDERAYNTNHIIRIVDSVWEYITGFKGNEVTSFFQVFVPKDKTAEFESMYSDPHSIYEYRKIKDGVYQMNAKPTDNLSKDDFIAYVMEKGFNLKQVVPFWSPLEVENAKVVDAAETSHISNETLYSKLISLQIPGLTNSEEFKNELDTIYNPESVYQINKDKYLEFCKLYDGKSYDEILSALEKEDMDNYYFVTLKYKLEKDLAVSEFAKDGLAENELSLLEIANPELYTKIGNYLNEVDIIRKGYEPTEDDINKLATATGISYKAAETLVNTLTHTEDMLRRSLVENNIMGKQDLLLSALSQFMHEGDAGSITIAVEYLAGATRKTQNEFMSFLNSAINDPENFTDEEKLQLQKLYDSLEAKLDLIRELDPTDEDEETYTGPLERLYALAGKNSPSVRMMIDSGFLNKSTDIIGDEILNVILRAGVSRELKRKQGSDFVKLSQQDLSNISTIDDYFTYSLGEILNATVMKGLVDKPGSVMIENMQRRDMIGRYMVSVIANISDLQDGLKIGGVNMDNDSARIMLTDLAITMHALTTGQDYQADYATSAFIRFNDETGDYEIVPLALAIHDEDNSLISYLLGRKTITSDFEQKDFSLKAIAKLRESNEHEHVFLYKGSKNMFIDSLEGADSRSAFISLDSNETRERFKDMALQKFLLDIDTRKELGFGYDINEIQRMVKNGTDINSYIAEYYSLKYTLPLQDLWYNFVKSFEAIGVSKKVLPTIFNSVQSMYAGREVKINDQLIDDVVERASSTLKDKTDEYQFRIIMDTLKYGINHAALTNEDKLNMANYSLRLRSEFEGTGISEEKLQSLDFIIDSVVDNSYDLEFLKEQAQSLTNEEKAYCIKQIMLKRLNGYDIFSILNSRTEDNSNGSLYLTDELLARNLYTKEELKLDSLDNKDKMTDWISKNKKYNVYTIAKNTVHAIFDLEWLTKKSNELYKDGLYQIAFAVRNPDANNENYYEYTDKTLDNNLKFNILVKSTLDSGAKQANEFSNNPDQLRYTESSESFSKKTGKALTNIAGLTDEQLINLHEIVVSTPKEAVEVAYRILKKLNVTTLLGFNSFDDDESKPSDIQFFRDFGYDMKEFDTVDIRHDVLNKIYTHDTEGLIGEQMDDVRKAGILKYYKEGVEHDALSDIGDEYELFCKIINNPTVTTHLYLEDADKLIDLFGDNYKEYFDLVNFDGIQLSKNLSDIYPSIDAHNPNFIRGNQSFKRILDDYNAVNFNHAFRRINMKALRNSIEDITDVYFSTYNKAYSSVVKNYKTRKAISNILLGLMNAYTDGPDIYRIIGDNDYSESNNKTISNALLRAARVVNEAFQIFSTSKRSGAIDPEIQSASRENMIKLFYAQKESDIKSQLAQALCIIDKVYNANDEDKLSKSGALNLFKQDDEIRKQYISAVEKMIDTRGNTIDTSKFFESLRTNRAMDYDKLQKNESQTNFVNGIMNPIARMLDLQMDDDVAKSYKNIDVDSVMTKMLSDETRKRLLNNLMAIKGTTEINKNNIKRAKELRTYNGRRVKLMHWADKYSNDMVDELMSKDGMFAKNLVQVSALWSMGTGRRSFRSDGEENTLYIGRDLLTSTKAYRSLYDKYKKDDTFYVLSWRQPLQQTTPLQVIKVKVVDGMEYSMTATTARNLHNGDFDGDYFYTSYPTDDIQKFGEALWKYQNVAGGLLSHIFKNVDYSLLSNRTQNEAATAKKTFNFLSNEFYNLLNDFDEEAYKDFENKFVAKYIELDGSSSLSRQQKAEAALRMLAAYGINPIKLHNETIYGTANPFFDDPNIKKLINERNTQFISNNQFDTGLSAPENGQAAKNYRGMKMTVPESELNKLFYVNSFSMDKDTLADLTGLLNGRHSINYDGENGLTSYIESLHSQDMLDDNTYNFAINFIAEMKANDSKISNEAKAQYIQFLAQNLQQAMQYSNGYKNTLASIVPEMLGKLDEQTYSKYKVLYKFMRDEFGNELELPELNEKSSGIDILRATTGMIHTFFDNKQAKDYIRYASSDDPFAFRIYADATFRGKQFGFDDIRDDTEVITADELVDLNINGKKAFGLADVWIAVDESDNSGLDTLQIVDNGKNGLSYTNVNKLDFNSLTKKQRQQLAEYISKTGTGKYISDKVLTDILGMDNDDAYKYQIVGVVNRLNRPVNVKSDSDLTDCTLIFIDTTSLYGLAGSENLKLGFTNAKAGKGTAVKYTGKHDFRHPVDIVMGKKLFDMKKLGNNLIEIKEMPGSKYKYYHVNNLALLNNLNFASQNKDKLRYIDQIGIVQGSHGLGSLLAFSNLYIKQNEDGTYTFDPTAYSDLQKAIGYDNLERRYYDTNASASIRLTRIIYLLSAIKDNEKLNQIIADYGHGKCNSIDEFAMYLMNDQSLGGDNGARIEAGIWRRLTTEEQNRIDETVSLKKNMFGRVAFSNEVDDAMINPYASYFKFKNNPVVSKHGKPTDESVRTSKLRGISDNEFFLAELEHSAHDLNDGNFIATENIIEMLLNQQGRRYTKRYTKAAYEDEVLDPIVGYLGHLYNGYHFIDSNQALKWKDYYGAWEESQTAKKAGNKRAYSEEAKNLEQFNLFETIPEESKYINEDIYDPDLNVYDMLYNSKAGNISKSLRYMIPFFGDGSDIQTREGSNMFNYGFGQTLHKRFASIDDDDHGVGLKVNTIRPEYQRDELGNVVKVNGIPQKIPQFKNYSYSEMEEFIKKNSRNPQEFERLLNKNQLFKQDFDKNKLDSKDIMNVLNIRIKKQIETSQQIQDALKSWNKLQEEYESYESITPEFNINKVNFLFNNPVKYDENNVLQVARIYSDDNGVKLVNSILNSYGYKATANGEIALGSKTLNFQNNIGQNKSDLLGGEYQYILSMAKMLPDAYIQLNKYMEIEAALEAYYELTLKNANTDNEKKYIKTLGKQKYTEYLEATKKAFGASTPEELRQVQLEMIKDNQVLASLVQASSNINKRLALEVSKVDPTGLIGWVLSSDAPTDDNSSWLQYRNVKLQKLYKGNFVESIQAIGRTINSMSDPEAASLFFNNKIGYIGMIEELSSRIATTQASDKLGSYLRSNGWMKNIDVVSEAMDRFEEKIASYYAESEDVYESQYSKKFLDNKELFETWVFMLNDAGIDVVDYLDLGELEYRNVSSLYKIFGLASSHYNRLLSELGVTGMQEARDKIYQDNINAENPEDKIKCDQKLKLLNAYENILSETIRTAISNGKYKDLFESINASILSLAKSQGKVLVDAHGRMINKGDETLDYSSNHFYFDILTMLKKPTNPDEIGLYNAQEALLGNVYLMDASVAQQLERKVYSRRIHSKVKTFMRKAKNLATALVMTSPVQLLDRLVNFPLFDAGVVGSADGMTMRYMPEAMATVMKYINAGDTIPEPELMKDPSMKKLLRFLTAANQNVFDNTVRGEEVKLSIPVIKQYTKLANLGYTAGNLIPRFAYYLNLLDSAESNGLIIDRNKTGVVWDKYDAINNIQAEDFVTKSDLYKEFGNNAQDYADVDSRIAYIIAQHNGLEGNMPYGARWLNENYNTMFLSFPMALLRWGKNRATSLGYAFADMCTGNSNKGFQYLAGQLGSVVLSQALLLGLQLLLSQDTREYIKKKITKKDDELTEEEIKNAETILFRGGVFKPFTSMIQGEEVTSSHQSRGPLSSLFDSYIADFTTKFGDSDKSIGEKIKNAIMQHTWAHTNFLPKDMIEAIPGNNFLQSTGWYNDSGNWFENYGRKVLGYSMGSAQASNFMNYMKSEHSQDNGMFKGSRKLANAMEYAYSEKYSNNKEVKSEARNYKKAIQLINDFYQTVYGDSKQSSNTYGSTSDEFTKKLKNAMETGSSAADVYGIIESALRKKEKSYIDIQKALRKISLRQRILTLPDYQKFLNSLSDSEYAVVKTALAYEDHHYPYLEDLLEKVNNEATKEYYQQNQKTKSIASILKTMSYNTPKVYSRYNKYNYRKAYNNKKLYIDQLRNQYKKNYNKPLDVYNNMINARDYRTSKDVWGNETRHYTDGTTYAVRQQGMPFPGGNK